MHFEPNNFYHHFNSENRRPNYTKDEIKYILEYRQKEKIKIIMKTPHEIYMDEQMKHPMQFGAYILPEQWQLDAMEAYANSKIELNTKLSGAIIEMVGSDLKRCTYYHKAATFVETSKGKFMLRAEYYDPPKVVMDDVDFLPTP